MIDVQITSGNLKLGSLAVDRRLAGSLELVEQEEAALVGNQRIVVVRIQHWEDMADQTLTFAEQAEQPLAVVQIYHLVCPFQPCVVSAYMHKPSSKPRRLSN